MSTCAQQKWEGTDINETLVKGHVYVLCELKEWIKLTLDPIQSS